MFNAGNESDASSGDSQFSDLSSSVPRPHTIIVAPKLEEQPITKPIPQKHAPRRVVWKTPVTVIGILIITIVTAEVSSHIAFAVLTGQRLSFDDVHEKQQELMAQQTAVLKDTDPEAPMAHLVAHPYLGYTRRTDDPNRVPGQDQLLGLQPLMIEPDESTAIVGVFGGSFAEQFSDGGQEALRAMLQSDPNFSGKDIHIFTGAMGGYKQPQHLLALNYMLSLGQHFDLILNIDGFNEIAGPPVSNIPRDISPFFPTGWYHLANRMPNVNTLNGIGRIINARKERQELAATMQSMPLVQWSATAQFLWKGWDNMLTKDIADAELALQQIPPEAGEDTRQQRIRGLPYDYDGGEKLTSDLVNVWERSSVLMHELALAHGIPYVHFLQPNQYDPGTKPLTVEEKKFALNEYSPYAPWVQKSYPALRQAGQQLKQKGIAFYDLSYVFGDTNETVYKDDCCHINNVGNAIIAQEIGKSVMTALRTSPFQEMIAARE